MSSKVSTVVGYIRVSTEEQGRSGAGLQAQEEAIRAECQRRGWQLVRVEQDKLSGKSINGRHGLTRSLEAVERGEADALMVAKLDRLGRSVVDVAGLLERAQRQGWALVALDVGIDTSTIMGAAMAQMASVFAEMERKRIGERTREGMAIKKAQGVHLGRRSTLAPGTRRRIRNLRTRGWSYARIAERLNAERVPTGQGGARWHATAVRVVAGDFDPDAPKRRRNAGASPADPQASQAGKRR